MIPGEIIPGEGEIELNAGLPVTTLTVANTGDRPGTDLVQLYARDVIGSVTRPVAQLLGYARVALEPGQEARVEFDVPTSRLAFTDRHGRRVVEPGDVELWVGPSCDARETEARLLLTGDVHPVSLDEPRLVGVEVAPLV